MPARTRLGDSSVPPLYLFVLGGYWRLGALPRRSPCRVRYNTFTAWFHNDCCFTLFPSEVVRLTGVAKPDRGPLEGRAAMSQPTVPLFKVFMAPPAFLDNCP